jgi:hypothetical protein
VLGHGAMKRRGSAVLPGADATPAVRQE